MELMNKYVNDIIKLSHTYANQHRTDAKYFEDFEDFVQELQLAALVKTNKYDETKATFATWCYLVFKHRTLHQIRNYMLNENKFGQLLSLNDTFSESNNPIVDTIADDNDFTEELIDRLYKQSIIDKIQDYISKEFMLHYAYGVKVVELAKIANTTEQNISNKLRRESSKLRHMLKSDEYFDKIKNKKLHKMEEYMQLTGCSKRTYFRRKSKYKEHLNETINDYKN